jgi:hypothetical protein
VDGGASTIAPLTVETAPTLPPRRPLHKSKLEERGGSPPHTGKEAWCRGAGAVRNLCSASAGIGSSAVKLSDCRLQSAHPSHS